MNLKDVEEMSPLGATRAHYLFCGPKPWMASVHKQLVEFGVANDALHCEAFGTGGVTA